MPGTDGFSLIANIRSDSRLAHLGIVVMTSGGQTGIARRCRELSVNSRLMKPVGTSELETTVRRVLGKGRPDPPLSVSAAEQPLSALRILLVEDNAVNRLVAVRLLQKRGHHVSVAVNGREALDQIERGEFDLVLMDVQMPELDGFEATAALREKEIGTGRHLPVIAMTAYAMQADRERCLAAGMDGYISKPFHSEEIFPVIERVLAEIGSGLAR